MSDEQNANPATDEQPTGTSEQSKQEAGQSDAKDNGSRNDVVDAVIGLAVLGVGAALMSGTMSLGGVLRGLTRGAPPRTPPIGPM